MRCAEPVAQAPGVSRGCKPPARQVSMPLLIGQGVGRSVSRGCKPPARQVSMAFSSAKALRRPFGLRYAWAIVVSMAFSSAKALGAA